MGQVLSPAAAKPAAMAENPLLGIALMIAAMFVVPAMDAIAKILSADYPVMQVVWARYFFHSLILLPVVLLRYRPSDLIPPRPALQILRGGFLLVSTLLFFGAIAVMPLADAIALVFVYPLVVTALSPLVLGEKVGLFRYSAVFLGFVGALIIIRPGSDTLQWSALMALAAAVVYAFYSLTTRKLSGTAPPLVTLTYTALLGSLVMTALLPAFWVTPSLQDLGLMLLMGAIAALGHWLVIKAYEHASASVIAPFGYSEIIMATAIGFVLFGDFPDGWTWAGVAVVVSSGVVISWRESRLAQRRRSVL